MVGAVVTADRALTAASGEAAAGDALESARAVEKHLASHVAALSGFREPFLLPPMERTSQLARLAAEYSRATPGLSDLQIVDSEGRVLYPASSVTTLAGPIAPTMA